MNTQASQATVTERTVKIRELNDAVRKELFILDEMKCVKCKVIYTRGIADDYFSVLPSIMKAVQEYSDFSDDNDPYAERDMGFFTLSNVNLMWKIDYLDLNLEFGSSDPSDSNVTHRVLTVLLANEY